MALELGQPLPFALGNDQVALGLGHVHAREGHEGLPALYLFPQARMPGENLSVDSRRHLCRSIGIQCYFSRRAQGLLNDPRFELGDFEVQGLALLWREVDLRDPLIPVAVLVVVRRVRYWILILFIDMGGEFNVIAECRCRCRRRIVRGAGGHRRVGL